MKYRLTVYPALERFCDNYKQFEFKTESELNAADNSISFMLLYLQDDLGVMPDYSNMFIREYQDESGEWCELEEDYA